MIKTIASVAAILIDPRPQTRAELMAARPEELKRIVRSCRMRVFVALQKVAGDGP